MYNTEFRKGERVLQEAGREIKYGKVWHDSIRGTMGKAGKIKDSPRGRWSWGKNFQHVSYPVVDLNTMQYLYWIPITSVLLKVIA